jgi:hypothetical protein
MTEPDKFTKPPTVARRVFISYSHDSAEHTDRVRVLADRLRKDGIDARIDQYTPDPDEGWPKWMRTQVKDADLVLLVFTEIYQRRYEGDEEEGKGLGVTFEGVIATQALYERGGSNAKFRPVVFREEDERFIPAELRRFNRYRVDTHDHYQKLLRWLYRLPATPPPPIGEEPTLAPESAPELFPDQSEKGDQTSNKPGSSPSTVMAGPPNSATGVACSFWLNYDGSIDTSDNGLCFFIDPTTGCQYNAQNTNLVGCALPRGVLLYTFLAIDSWKTLGIERVWQKYASSVVQYVLANRPLIRLSSGGKTISNIPLVDVCFVEGFAIEVTYPLARELNIKGKTLATYEIFLDGTPIEIKGWNWETQEVG